MGWEGRRNSVAEGMKGEAERAKMDSPRRREGHDGRKRGAGTGWGLLSGGPSQTIIFAAELREPEIEKRFGIGPFIRAVQQDQM